MLVIILLAVIFYLIISNIFVVQQSRAYVIERLGAFHAVQGVGLHFKMPLIDRIARRVSLKEQVLDYPPQPVITKDNVTMQIDTVVYFQITDPKLYTYGVEQPMAAMETLIYTCDLWEIMKTYQSPEEANLREAVDMFAEEVYSIIAVEEADEENEDEE